MSTNSESETELHGTMKVDVTTLAYSASAGGFALGAYLMGKSANKTLSATVAHPSKVLGYSKAGVALLLGLKAVHHIVVAANYKPGEKQTD